MKRSRLSAFSAGILAVAMAAAGLFPAQQAQAQTYKYGPSGINPREQVVVRVTGRDVEVTGTFIGPYLGTLNCDIPGEAGVTNLVGHMRLDRADGQDYQVPYTTVSSTHFRMDHTAGNWLLNLESGPTFPTVSITAPSGGATYTSPATVNITANASDTDGTITKVEFYQGTTKLGEDTDSSGGWTYSWTGVAAGSYSLTAKAFDNDGLSKISAAVGITVNQRTTPLIDNAAASGLTAGSATLNGNLTSAGTAATTVYVYWGTVDPGQTTSGWDGSQNLGVRSPGAVSHPVSGLSAGSTYHYRFFAQNSNGSDWGDPAESFETLSAPVVDNDGGATDITPRRARLRGTLTAGGSAEVTIYWGTVDGGTSTSAWEHANSLGTASEGALFTDLSGLDPSATYRYRCYAENVVGSDWADATATFQTLEQPDCRMKITFSGYTNRTEALTNFPALVVFNTSLSNFDYDQFLSTNGYDLRFRDAGDTVELNYEIEQWNTDGSSYVWVQVPLILTNSDYIWASWGDPGASNRLACTTNGATWDATFKAVWHMNQVNAQDSTVTGHDGVGTGNSVGAGKIADGGSFNGSAGVYVSSTAGFPTTDSAKTLSAWARSGGTGGWKWLADYQDNHAILGQRDQQLVGTWQASPDHIMIDSFWTDANKWRHVVVSSDGTTASLYGDGVLLGSKSGGYTLSQTGMYIGRLGAGEGWLGDIDEVRIENVARSSDWIWACYMTMGANTAFTTYGAVSISGGDNPTVTFNANGGSGAMSPQSSSVAANLTLNTFTRSGYTFAGWNTVAGGGGTAYADGASYSFAASITLYAQWTAVPTYTVTYDANGATSGTAPGSQTKTHDVTLTLASNSGNLAKTGYTFAGWNTAANGSGTDYAAGGSYTANAAVTLYAKWTEVPTHTVTFNANGGSGTMSPQSSPVNVAANLTLNTFTRTGYAFAGWNTAADGSGTSYADGASYSFAASITLYAQWTAVPTYTVTYDANGATSGTAPDSQTKTEGVPLTLANNSGNLAKTGYTFAGWNTAANGSGTDYAAGGSYTANAAVTLYAKWTVVPTYTITYDANGATSGTAPDSQTKTEGVPLTLANNSGNLARTDYTFAGWNTAADGSGTGYAAGASYTTDASVTLYAKWNDSRAVAATGGTVTTSGGYTIHTFTSSGTFTVTTGGDVEYLVVGGGGGGGGGNGGGGGAGGFRTGTLAVTAQAYPITVGAGGNGGHYIYTTGGSYATEGGDSTFSSITSVGGGRGGGGVTDGISSGAAGGNGGSGGGGASWWTGGAGGSGTSGQGNNGGTAYEWGPYTGGGGGGASQAGADGNSTHGGKGGDGTASSISGSIVTYAGGGGGSTESGTPGLGGSGGGGDASIITNGEDGDANTGGGGGGGGGGGSSRKSGGNGGSGIVIIRYLTEGGGIADADGDGMDDDWENTYLGGTNTSSGTAGEDYDGDGFCDLHEYIAGTNPTNAASVLKVVQVSPDAASNFVLDWASVAGKVYRVGWIADLMTPPWQTVASSIAATPPLNVHTISVTGVESGFYRVEVQP